jgi:hypothetical protein
MIRYNGPAFGTELTTIKTEWAVKNFFCKVKKLVMAVAFGKVD